MEWGFIGILLFVLMYVCVYYILVLVTEHRIRTMMINLFLWSGGISHIVPAEMSWIGMCHHLVIMGHAYGKEEQLENVMDYRG